MKKALSLLLISLILLSGLFYYQYRKFNDSLLHVVFCNVGQGDAILIRSPQGKSILFDAGPDDGVLSCLAEHLPFWERSISMVILSHPHADHFRGLFSILDRYSIEEFDSENLDNNITEYQAIKQNIAEKGIKKRFVLRGDRFRLPDGVSIRILGPNESFLTATSPRGMVGESKEFASLIAEVSYGSFTILLTGDAQNLQLLEDITANNIKQINVLQVPHHGSATGLTSEIVQQLDPELAVISVGKNRYGHPSKKTLGILGDRDIRILRTDQDKDVEVVSNGKDWWIKR